MSRKRRAEPEFADCPCAGSTLNKLVHPAILTVLGRGPLHGYGTVREIGEMPMFAGEKPDPAGVYRCLKLMEEQGLLTSSWDLPDAGPAKRSYALTAKGRECLRQWIGTLEQHREAIGALLALARKAVAHQAAE